MMCRLLVAVGLASIACGDPPEPTGWMASIDDTKLLSELSIPGTHESAALYEPLRGTAKCQQLTIAEQLELGVRFFDIRCRHMYDAFAIYHGPIDQLQTFDDILATVTTFLDANPTETIIMSVKEESEPVEPTRSFEATFATYVARDPDRWYDGEGAPSLGDARGKIVLVRRFAGTATPLGIDASVWADNTTFSIDNAASLRVQDEYRVEVTDEKWQAITALLDEAEQGLPTTLFLNFTSGYETHNGLPDNLAVAEPINTKLDALLREGVSGRLGTLVMDHVEGHRIRAIIATNSMP